MRPRGGRRGSDRGLTPGRPPRASVHSMDTSARLAQIQTRLRRVDPLVVDLALVALLLVIGVASLNQPLPPGSRLRPADPAAFALVVALCVPLVVRRRAPRAALAAVLV